METKRNACYECAHRRDLVNNAHSECVHPGRINEMPHFIADCLDGIARTNAARPLNIKFVTHAIKSGWAAWPINFDPVWLITCDGFTPNTKKETTLAREGSNG